MDALISNLPSALCVLLGMALIMVEVFLPGFGLPGISGIVLLGIGAIMIGMSFGAVTAVGVLLVIIAVLAVLVSWVLRSAARGKMRKSELFLNESDDLYRMDDMQVFVGRTGKALSVLRPAGIGDFDGVRLNIVTEGSYIESGSDVEIIRVEGVRIVVRQKSA